MKRWYYFLVADYKTGKSWWLPEAQYLSDRELFDTLFRTKAENLGMSIYPFTYSYKTSVWVWDPRTDRQILAGESIPGYVG